MKYLLFLLFLAYSQQILATDICDPKLGSSGKKSSWSEADFTKKKAEESMQTLNNILKDPSNYDWVAMGKAQDTITGFIIKRRALTLISNDADNKEKVKKIFCEFLYGLPTKRP